MATHLCQSWSIMKEFKVFSCKLFLLNTVGFVVAAGLSPLARAKPRKTGKERKAPIAITRFEGKGIPYGALPRFRQVVKGVLQGTEHGLVSSQKVKKLVSAKPYLASCQDDVCTRELLKGTGAFLGFDINIQGHSGTTYQYTVRVVAASTSEKTISVKDSCDVCTLQEALMKLSQVVREALKQALTARPAPQRPGPGPVRPRVSRAARTGPTAKQPVAAAVPKKPDIDLQKRLNVSRSLKLSGWILGGVGLAGVIAGTVLTSLNNKCSSGGSSECTVVYHTIVPGVVCLAAGGAILVTGITLYLVGWKKGQASDSATADHGRPWGVAVAPTFSGGMVVTYGRF